MSNPVSLPPCSDRTCTVRGLKTWYCGRCTHPYCNYHMPDTVHTGRGDTFENAEFMDVCETCFTEMSVPKDTHSEDEEEDVPLSNVHNNFVLVDDASDMMESELEELDKLGANLRHIKPTIYYQKQPTVEDSIRPSANEHALEPHMESDLPK